MLKNALLLAVAACVVYAKTIYVQNPGNSNDIQPNLKTALYNAGDGDVLVLPSGHFSFTGNIDTEKSVSVRGQGKDKTIVFRPESMSDAELNTSLWMMRFKINNAAACNIIISDISFKSKRPLETNGDGGSIAEDYGLLFNKCLNFIVTRCRFENFGFAGISIMHWNDVAGGLIVSNDFVHNYRGPDGRGLGYGVAVYGENTSWVDSPHFGSSNFIFIEDNYFERHRHAIAGGGCGLYVCRYNIFKDHLLLAAAIDMHEARGEGNDNNYYATRAAEVYKNALSNENTYPLNNSIAAIGPRGGEILAYSNIISHFRFGVKLIPNYKTNFGPNSNYPHPYMTGYKSGLVYGSNHSGIDAAHGDGDGFFWDNTFINSDAAGKAFYISEIYSTIMRDGTNRDFHFVAKPGYAPFQYPHPLRALIPAPPAAPPQVSISPAAFTANKPFSTTLSVDKQCGFWSTNGTVYHQFTVAGTNLYIDATTTVSYFGRDVSGNTSGTNTCDYTVVITSNLDNACPVNEGSGIIFKGIPGGTTGIIYSVSGRFITALAANDRGLVWDMHTADGKRAAPGVYLCRLSSLHETRTIKVMVIR